MSGTEDGEAPPPPQPEKKHVQSPPPSAPPAPDVESRGAAAAAPAAAGGGSGMGVSAIVRRWRRDDLIRKGSLVLRGLALLFSLLAFIIMASNKHGGWKDFDNYEEFRYLLAISILATLYTGVQALRHVHRISTGQLLVQRQTSALIDFAGDQVVAYLLISAASTAVPMTNRMRDNVDNLFTDCLAASISMAFFAFLTLAFSALIAGYKLSTQSYI
ncbi:CASP-like protein 4B1 [Syzygium oleosum]|uniref:CASP-like protein 4B1 n=1 Tax=Syzygium oleosum TaxID=219896 RepID=UPI0024BB4873|nr:CASP-like protein 4B1 [Syzygium oleosum]